VLSGIYLHGWDKRMGGYGVLDRDDSDTPRKPVPPRSLQKNSGGY